MKTKNRGIPAGWYVPTLDRFKGQKQAYPSEAAYHVALCLFDMADPSAGIGRRRRAAEALPRWQAAVDTTVIASR
jgi:hypothetical protein